MGMMLLGCKLGIQIGNWFFHFDHRQPMLKSIQLFQLPIQLELETGMRILFDFPSLLLWVGSFWHVSFVYL